MMFPYFLFFAVLKCSYNFLDPTNNPKESTVEENLPHKFNTSLYGSVLISLDFDESDALLDISTHIYELIFIEHKKFNYTNEYIIKKILAFLKPKFEENEIFKAIALTDRPFYKREYDYCLEIKDTLRSATTYYQLKTTENFAKYYIRKTCKSRIKRLITILTHFRIYKKDFESFINLDRFSYMLENNYFDYLPALNITNPKSKFIQIASNTAKIDSKDEFFKKVNAYLDGLLLEQNSESDQHNYQDLKAEELFLIVALDLQKFIVDLFRLFLGYRPTENPISAEICGKMDDLVTMLNSEEIKKELDVIKGKINQLRYKKLVIEGSNELMHNDILCFENTFKNDVKKVAECFFLLNQLKKIFNDASGGVYRYYDSRF